MADRGGTVDELYRAAKVRLDCEPRWSCLFQPSFDPWCCVMVGQPCRGQGQRLRGVFLADATDRHSRVVTLSSDVPKLRGVRADLERDAMAAALRTPLRLTAWEEPSTMTLDGIGYVMAIDCPDGWFRMRFANPSVPGLVALAQAAWETAEELVSRTDAAEVQAYWESVRRYWQG
ncbi:MAG: hypothetical protein RLY93_03695 [Sumerlaeia bacterium]